MQYIELLLEKTCFYGPAKYHVIISYDGPFTKWIRSSGEYPIADYGIAIEALENADGVCLPKPDKREIIVQAAFRCRRAALLWARARSRDFHNIRVEMWPL